MLMKITQRYNKGKGTVVLSRRLHKRELPHTRRRIQGISVELNAFGYFSAGIGHALICDSCLSLDAKPTLLFIRVRQKRAITGTNDRISQYL